MLCVIGSASRENCKTRRSFLWFSHQTGSNKLNCFSKTGYYCFTWTSGLSFGLEVVSCMYYTYSQTKIYSDTFNISHIITVYSLNSSLGENGNKTWQELRVKLCQNKFIMSDYFNRKVCDGLKSTKHYSLLNLSKQLDNTNSGQPINKQCFILFSLWCKKFALAVKEKTRQQNMLRSKCLNNFGPNYYYYYLFFYW